MVFFPNCHAAIMSLFLLMMFVLILTGNENVVCILIFGIAALLEGLIMVVVVMSKPDEKITIDSLDAVCMANRVVQRL